MASTDLETTISVYDITDVIRIGNIQVHLVDQEGKIILKRVIKGDEHILQLIMPWGKTYEIMRLDDEKSAKTAFKSYDIALTKGCNISITGSEAIIYPRPFT